MIKKKVQIILLLNGNKIERFFFLERKEKPGIPTRVMELIIGLFQFTTCVLNDLKMFIKLKKKIICGEAYDTKLIHIYSDFLGSLFNYYKY